jgi:hypothetical protein
MFDFAGTGKPIKLSWTDPKYSNAWLVLDRNGNGKIDSALEMFGRVFGGATAFPKAKGIWRDDERGGTLVRDEPIVVHCYTTPVDIEDDRNLAALGDFCRKLGRETRQGEIGLVVGDEYFVIRDFNEGAMA